MFAKQLSISNSKNEKKGQHILRDCTSSLLTFWKFKIITHNFSAYLWSHSHCVVDVQYSEWRMTWVIQIDNHCYNQVSPCILPCRWLQPIQIQRTRGCDLPRGHNWNPGGRRLRGDSTKRGRIGRRPMRGRGDGPLRDGCNCNSTNWDRSFALKHGYIGLPLIW